MTATFLTSVFCPLFQWSFRPYPEDQGYLVRLRLLDELNRLEKPGYLAEG